MRMQTKLSIVTVVVAGALLLCALAVIFTLRAQTAYAEDPPHVSISIGEATLPQGGSTYLFGTFQNLPKDPNVEGKFHPDLRYRFDLDRHSEGTWSDANDCESDNFGNYKGIDTYWRDRLDIEVGAHNGLAIGSNCPVGRYRIRLAAKLTSSNTDFGHRYPRIHSYRRAFRGNRFVVHLNNARGANRRHLEIFSSEQYSR